LPARCDPLADDDALSDADDDLEEGAEAGPNASVGTGGTIHRLVMPADQDGQRLDRALATLLDQEGLSRTRLQALAGMGMVRCEGALVGDLAGKARQGRVYEVLTPAPVPIALQAEAIALTILYEDADVIVIDKPAGMVVHPAAGHEGGTLANALLHHCGAALSGIGGALRPGIVHRLDKDTSGLMVAAKSQRGHQGLAAQFADRSLSRTYWALIQGKVDPLTGMIEAPIGRHPRDRKRMAVLARGGKPAITRYRCLEVFTGAGPQGVCLTECTLLTGRTHQIRVHMAHRGWPLVGDPVYGRPIRPSARASSAVQALVAFPRQALHAVGLTFIHPTSQEKMTFQSSLPDDFSCLLAHLRA
jgi:23S rRNA pseudouridine1911/1915/1917 synthase